MTKPLIAATQPIAVTLEAGRQYWWCRCGRSRTQPFCDGSHAGTGIEPLAFTAPRSEEAWLCQCKQTADPPWCDGSHQGLATGDASLARIRALSAESAPDELVSMGVPRERLPSWDELLFLPAPLARGPLPDEVEVATETLIGPRARRPLRLAIPLLVADMSFGALSQEAKVALARGAAAAGTAVASGEGGMLAEERRENPRYLFELGPAGFGYHEGIPAQVAAFHFKLGQAAKAGAGGHLPAAKVTEAIARTRGIPPGRDAHSPARFPHLKTAADFRHFADQVRELGDGLPVGMKMAAGHIEADLDFALEAGMDYVILDGRGGATGAAPQTLRDHLCLPTLPALARARRHLDACDARHLTLIVSGGLRLPEEFAKALALGADAVALGSAALQALGCIASRQCHTGRCPTGIATQDPDLRRRLEVEKGAQGLSRFLTRSVALMTQLARACGRAALAELSAEDLASPHRRTAELAQVAFMGDPPGG